MVTAFKNIFDRSPFYVSMDKALDRIRSGASRSQIEAIRSQLNKERADKLKQNLPCFLFSGEFLSREDSSLKKHSGFLVADFDEIDDLRSLQVDIISQPFVYACWVSPRGNGLKALIRIADGGKHREHFAALQEVFPQIDKSGVNEARVCYESYDPDIYVNPKATPFKKTKKVEVYQSTESVHDDGVFKRLVTWLVNKGDAFVSGERNFFIFKLASACCRFGLSQDETIAHILRDYSTDNTFTQTEATRAVESAYKANKLKQGSARFEKDVLVESVTRSEVVLENWIEDGKVKDIIYGESVKEQALEIYDHGYEKVHGIGVPQLDELFKLKKGDITLLTGIGNYGKSAFLKFLLMMRVILFGEKFALFPPEDNPAHEFYHELTEMILGCDCTPRNPDRPNRDSYNAAYDWISKYIFFLHPKTLSPTPDYIKEKFLEMIITEGIAGNIIDPFNQMANDYSKVGGRDDKYLETFLGDYSRFNQENGQYGIIVAHPRMLSKQGDGNYPCPDVFDLAGGAMWNNKMDNIIVYHRPMGQTEPDNPICEFYSKKIRRQRIVGKKGSIQFELSRPRRRFYFDGKDVLGKALKDKGIEFEVKQSSLWQSWRPVQDYQGDNPF